jgi:hypothetical protein
VSTAPTFVQQLSLFTQSAWSFPVTNMAHGATCRVWGIVSGAGDTDHGDDMFPTAIRITRP